jgi:uncharacterized protein YcbX
MLTRPCLLTCNFIARLSARCRTPASECLCQRPPNVLIDVEGKGWLEDEWVGRTLSIGAVVLVPFQPCIRCTMVTRAQPSLEADVDVFCTLARHHRGLFGVWCDVLTGGTLSVGEEAIVGARRPVEGGAHR